MECRDAEMNRWMPNLPAPYERSHAVAHIEHAAAQWAARTGAVFVIAQPDGTGIGLIELRILSEGHGSIGYWVARAHRRRGAATTAVQLVSEWALTTLRLARISLITDPENIPSQRVAERAGYQREGLLRAWLSTPRGRRDCVMFSRIHRSG